MELKFADTLTPDQLMQEDLIKFGDSVVEVVSVESDANGDIYFVSYQDEFGEKDVAEFYHTDVISLYVYVDDDE
jgi:hypothetical protein